MKSDLRIFVAGTGKTGSLVLECLNQPNSFGKVSGAARAATSDLDIINALRHSDVIVDFSSAAALRERAALYTKSRVPWVIGTTGWSEFQPELERLTRHHDSLAVYSANFSPVVRWFRENMIQLAQQLHDMGNEFRIDISETHAPSKKDSPSGTALQIKSVLTQFHPASIESHRNGTTCGRHEIRWSNRDDAVTFSHEALNRKTFAMGALKAAPMATREFMAGRRGCIDFNTL